jgi:hypothetical protein
MMRISIPSLAATAIAMALMIPIAGYGDRQAATQPTRPFDLAETGAVEIVKLTPNARRATITGDQAKLLRSVLREAPIAARGRNPRTETDVSLRNRHSWAELLIDGHRIRVDGHRWVYRDAYRVYSWANVKTYAFIDILISDVGRELEGEALEAFIEKEIDRVSKWVPPAHENPEAAAPQALMFKEDGPIELRVSLGPTFRIDGDVAAVLRQELNAPHSTWPMKDVESAGRFDAIPSLIMVIDGHELKQYGIGWSGRINDTVHMWSSPLTYALDEAVEDHNAPLGVLKENVRILILEAAALQQMAPPPPAK